jgi:membrane-associated phospholipid phosphatase
MAFFALCLGALICLAVWLSRRRRHVRYPQLFYGFPASLKEALFSRRALWVYAASAITTAFLALSDLDWTLQRGMQLAEPLGRETAYFFLLWGNFWHTGLALLLLVCARLRACYPVYRAAAAGAQALIMQLFVVQILKTLSGRRGPLNPDFASASSFIRKTMDPADFVFDFWNHGFMDGRFFWPSGHTATAFAFAAAFTFALPWRYTSFPLRILIIALWLLAAFTGLAMVDGDFHWTSDVLAGAAIGALIGAKTGSSLYRRYPSRE